MRNSPLKAQSAMEYLMTYGWAIVIIAVVLGALYTLGVFNAGGASGNSCIAVPNFECQSPTLTTGGTLTFTLGALSTTSFYNIQLACTATSGTAGPTPISAFNTITAGGAAQLWNTIGTTLSSSLPITISGLPCYTQTGAMLGSNTPIGASYTGSIWLNYTVGSAAENPGTNPWYTTKIITLKAKVI